MTQKEIENIAKEKQVSKSTIDKDWMLAHFLNAMYSFKDIRQNFIFKGGTCLKKCYFEDYRFSEDLDFTLLDKNFRIDTKFINKIIKTAEKTSKAKFHFDKKKIQKSKEQEQGYEIKVKLWGADHNPNRKPLPPERWQTSIKLDISFSEKLLTKPVYKPILHNYSDKEKIIQTVSVYSLPEIISEKLRSLIQRNRPRDIYDIHTLSGKLPETKYPEIKRLLFEKSKNKNIVISGISDFINNEKASKNKRAWESSLGNHLPANKLPDFDIIYKSITKFIENILDS